MAAKVHPDNAPERLLATLAADSTLERDPAETETLPISEIIEDLTELRLPTSLPADLQRAIAESSSPAASVLGLLENDDQMLIDDIERMAIAEVTEHLQRLNIDYRSDLDRIKDLDAASRSTIRPQLPISKTPDHMLIEFVADGDKQALEQLFARHSARIYRFVLSITGNTALSEDIVSEVFLEVWRRPGRFQGKAQVSTWMFAIARNRALQALRSRWQTPSDEDGAAEVADSVDDPEAAVHEKSRSIGDQ
jgi:hypothetical protein